MFFSVPTTWYKALNQICLNLISLEILNKVIKVHSELDVHL